MSTPDADNEQRTMLWWDAAPDRELTVTCDHAVHRLRWRAGSIELLDHPDLDAELAMVALGGAEPACLAMFQLWQDAVSDGGFLGEWVDEVRLSPAWFSWLAMALERMRSEGFHEFLRGLPPPRAQRMGEFLHHYPLPFIDRAAATVSHRVFEESGVVCGQAPGLLSAGVAQRVRRAFVDSVGGRQLAVGAAALVPLDISVGGGEGSTVSGALTGPDRGVALTVDRNWLHRVWAAGAAVIDGHLVTDMAYDGAMGSPVATASLVVWPTQPDPRPTPMIERRTVRLDQDRWRVD